MQDRSVTSTSVFHCTICVSRWLVCSICSHTTNSKTNYFVNKGSIDCHVGTSLLSWSNCKFSEILINTLLVLKRIQCYMCFKLLDSSPYWKFTMYHECTNLIFLKRVSVHFYVLSMHMFIHVLLRQPKTPAQNALSLVLPWRKSAISNKGSGVRPCRVPVILVILIILPHLFQIMTNYCPCHSRDLTLTENKSHSGAPQDVPDE